MERLEQRFTIIAKQVLLLLFLVIVAACATSVGNPSAVRTQTVGSIPEEPGPSYLEETIPPCKPLSGSQDDPCDRGVTEVETRSISLSYPLWPSMNIIPTFDQILLGYNILGDENYPHNAPHIVVRGTVVPDTTRCEPYSGWLANYKDPDRRAHTGDAYHDYVCLSDVKVNKYIVGIGPSRLTVVLHRERIGHSYQDPEDWPTSKDEIVALLDDPRARTAAAFEGRELILFLRPSPTLAVEAWLVNSWSSFELWFVQRGEDVIIREVGIQTHIGSDSETTITTPNSGDEVRAVAQAIIYATNDEQRNELNIPLTQLVRDVKQAAENRIATTGGRIGEATHLPMLVTDANRLRDYYEAVGANYKGDEATVAPPVVVPGIPPNLAVSESWVVSWDPPERGGEAHWYRLELRFTSEEDGSGLTSRERLENIKPVVFTTRDRTANIKKHVSDHPGETLDLRVAAENFNSGLGQWTDTRTFLYGRPPPSTTTTTSTTVPNTAPPPRFSEVVLYRNNPCSFNEVQSGTWTTSGVFFSYSWDENVPADTEATFIRFTGWLHTDEEGEELEEPYSSFNRLEFDWTGSANQRSGTYAWPQDSFEEEVWDLIDNTSGIEGEGTYELTITVQPCNSNGCGLPRESNRFTVLWWIYWGGYDPC